MIIAQNKARDTQSTELKRSLSTRHVQMLSIGGVIGVGLFYGATLSVKLAGPGVLLDFVICGIIVAIVMRALGEMTVNRPISGSFSTYAREQFGLRVGFITAGMWWFYWVTTVMSELAAIGKLIQYWDPNFPVWLPGLIALVLFTVSNLFAVRIFGEIEYWFAILKILAITAFMAIGLLMIATGIFSHGRIIGIQNLWIHGGFLPHGWIGVLMAVSLVIQAYSGIETLAVESGESMNPENSMRKAFRTVTLRICLLYIGSMFIMLCAFPWNTLIHDTTSPYVALFALGGLPVAGGIVNLIIIFSGLSSCNTGLYGGSRIIFGLNPRQEDSSVMKRLNRNQVPHIAVWITALAISVGIAITYLAPNYVYIWITSASAFASIFTWGMILVSELSFRTKQNHEEKKESIKYAMPWWPVLPIVGLTLLLAAFIAIVVSPLTRISVWAGVGWLLILWMYPFIRAHKKKIAS